MLSGTASTFAVSDYEWDTRVYRDLSEVFVIVNQLGFLSLYLGFYAILSMYNPHAFGRKK